MKGGINLFSWKSQSSKGDYRIQIETDDLERYKKIEKFCQEMIDEGSISALTLPQYDEWNNVATTTISDKYDPCAACPNNKKNGGSGICNCTIPYMNKTTGIYYQSVDSNTTNSKS